MGIVFTGKNLRYPYFGNMSCYIQAFQGMNNKTIFESPLATSQYSLSLVIGSLTGGYVSTYLHWTTLFLIPLLSLLILPFIMKYLPKEKAKKSHVDVIGLFLIAAIATSVLLYISNFNWFYIIVFIVAVVLFLAYISKSTKSLIGISFFQNKRFVYTLAVAFVIYTVQLGYIFIFPFLLQKVYGLELDIISLLLIPGYVTAIIIGALSGKIANRLRVSRPLPWQ